MSRVFFRNAMVWDGSGANPFPADVLVEGNRIRTVARSTGQLSADGATVIDCQGKTLMPGLVEGHAHLSYGGAVNDSDLGNIPPEEHVLLTMRNAKTLLDHGFTSAFSAASSKLRLDVVIRNEVEAGRLPGPRIRACSPEITVTGGLGDERKQHMYYESFGMIADGPDEIARTVRLCCREGVDNIKINISGDDLGPKAHGGMTVMRENEVQTAVSVARDFGKVVACHSRSAESVKRAVRCGVDVIYHCESSDEEALDMLESVKDRIFVGPAIGVIYGTLYDGEPWFSREFAIHIGMQRVIDDSHKVYSELRKRGVRALIGGDYGFVQSPQGTNARDLKHFVDLLGYSSSEALQCGTRIGGQVMGMGHELGQVKEGFLADLLLVNGDPLKDLSIMVPEESFLVIMKDGALYKNIAQTRAQERAAE
ncbi:MAG TPA: amidohydrolase family protein [Hypericibacter adhaerens]|jgi:imidazolonepropionase-like amidohydrolase|uniref:Amidohydrolase n=1 Tax=Hypericibacter adhaerens TaxID=2602016 RepID=A0A5J6N302_9PROT|nr:amidohydrolase family protein [Hypericibacter adhaerens]QEX23694.1 amidohydrolase [Hypericibacter adhaerens]HWA45616.1 amidohydrolase family protein [Hypericibacter adhaerens]